MNSIRPLMIVIAMLASSADAADWPMFRADAARSGYTAQELPNELRQSWTYQANQRPASAWPTRNRLTFDRVYQPVVAGGMLYYGGSVDDKVYALDATTGQLQWTFFTDAPVRFAPAVWRDSLFVASDDGYLYCLSTDNGELLWRRRGGPRADMLLGNDRMISRWPARGGPVIVDDIVYFGAGIWPSEGIFLYALDPQTGDILWENDSSGSIEMDQPHGTARAKSGLSAQGYLAATGDSLLVPTGRAVPAVLNRTNGTLRHFQLQMHQQAGGADVVVIDEYYANGGVLYAAADGTRVDSIGLRLAVHPDYVISAVGSKITGRDRRRLVVERDVVDRKGNKQRAKSIASPAWEVEVDFAAEPSPPIPEDLQPPEVRMTSTAWTTPVLQGEATALIVAADRVIVGGRGRVSVIDIPTRTLTWSTDVEGTVYGLAASDGRLYASTDRGRIYCFEDVKANGPAGSEYIPPALSVSNDSRYSSAVNEIVQRTGITEGFCVHLECGDGSSTLALAQGTKLKIYATDPDPANVQKARERLDLARMYGTRVTVHQCEAADVPYADYCADLVISGRSLKASRDDGSVDAAERLQRPCGGKICFGPEGSMQVSTRGPLEDAGNWTHQNAGPANTLCSQDARVRGELQMLWFRDTDFLMVNRHGRAPPALVQDGRMFVEGLNGLRAQSVYNGRVLWEFSAPGILSAYNREHSIGAAWTGGNICLSPDRIFLHNDRTCFVLDAATGKEVARIAPPPRPDGKAGTWGYLAYQDGKLFGSLANEEYLIKCWSDRWDTGRQFTESILLFAQDADTGRMLWSFTPEHSIRHNAIAIGGGRVYLIDRPVAAQDDLNFTTPQERRGDSKPDAKPEHSLGRLIALDARSGKRLWDSERNIFGTLLAYMAEDDLVWMGYQAAHQASRPSELGNRMAVFNAADGTCVWNIQAEYADRPVLNGRTIYAPPGAWDLLTGRRLPFKLERSYGCGIVAGCRGMLVFRSATLGYIDLSTSSETLNYGGIRPGCWIVAIPAGGVLTMPDAASWCTCSYLNQGTLALRPIGDPVNSDSGTK